MHVFDALVWFAKICIRETAQVQGRCVIFVEHQRPLNEGRSTRHISHYIQEHKASRVESDGIVLSDLCRTPR
jgi:hypothetical protein